MASFNYTSVTDSGKRITGSLKCRDRGEALSKLVAQGLHPLTINEVNENTYSVAELKNNILHRITVSDIAVLTRQLAALLKAGLPMVQTLSTLQKQCQHKRMKRVIFEIEESISRDGGTLGDALDEHPNVFDAVYRGLVKAGEQGGGLVEILGKLSSHLSKSARLKGQVIGAFVYPVFLLLLGITAVFVLIAFVIPRFRELFDTFGQNLPGPTKLLIEVSEFMSSYWWLVIGSSVFGFLMLLTLLRKEAFRKKVDGILLRLPIFGNMFLKMEICRIARTLGSLLNGGVAILEALRITEKTAKNLVIRGTFSEIIKGVASGQTLTSVMDKTGIYPPLATNLIKTGEDTGELTEMLNEIASIYEDETERAVNGAIKLIEPVLIVVIGGVIAGIVAAVMLPLFQANNMVN